MATKLHWLDYVVFVGFLSISLSIGVFHSLTGGRQRTTAEFLMANRKLTVIPTVLSITMSYVSAILVLGQTSEIYQYGIANLLGFIVISSTTGVLVERLVVPWLYSLQLVSAYAYLERRYNSKAVHLYGATLGIVSGILYIAVAILAPSLALESVTGVSMYVSIPVMAVLATLYTALGGMRAVIWTDVFQSVIMVAGMIAVLIKASILVGGTAEAFQIASDEGRLKWLRWTPDPRERNTVWSMLFGLTVIFLHLKGFAQPSIQRYSATSTLREARLTLYGDVMMSTVMFIITGLSAILVFSYYAKLQCDPIEDGQIKSANQVFPLFVKTAFESNQGFTGLFMATLYSGGLSSVSSSLSGTAANIWEDLLKWRFQNVTPARAALINKALVVLVGSLSCGFAFMASAMPGPVSQVSLSFVGSCGAPIIGMFLIGGSFRFVNWIGALAGGMVGFGFNMWVSIGSSSVPPYTKPLPPVSTEGCLDANITHLLTARVMANLTAYNSMEPNDEGSALTSLYQICYLWYGVFGLLLTVVVGVTVSIATNVVTPHVVSKSKVIPDQCFIPWRAAFTFDQVPGRDETKSEMKSSPRTDEFLEKDSAEFLKKDSQNHISTV